MRIHDRILYSLLRLIEGLAGLVTLGWARPRWSEPGEGEREAAVASNGEWKCTGCGSWHDATILRCQYGCSVKKEEVYEAAGGHPQDPAPDRPEREEGDVANLGSIDIYRRGGRVLIAVDGNVRANVNRRTFLDFTDRLRSTGEGAESE